MANVESGFKGHKAAQAGNMLQRAEWERHEAAFDLASHAERVKFAANAVDSMALLAVEYETRHGDLDLLESFDYFDALQRLTSYVCGDAQALQDEAYRLAREL